MCFVRGCSSSPFEHSSPRDHRNSTYPSRHRGHPLPRPASWPPVCRSKPPAEDQTTRVRVDPDSAGNVRGFSGMGHCPSLRPDTRCRRWSRTRRSAQLPQTGQKVPRSAQSMQVSVDHPVVRISHHSRTGRTPGGRSLMKSVSNRWRKRVIGCSGITRTYIGERSCRSVRQTRPGHCVYVSTTRLHGISASSRRMTATFDDRYCPCSVTTIQCAAELGSDDTTTTRTHVAS